jgi:hypothetical protein
MTLSLSPCRWLAQGLHEVAEGVDSVEDVYGLTTIVASRIVPTELNSYLYRYEGHLSRMAGALAREEEAASYQAAAQSRKVAMNTLMWNASTSRCAPVKGDE